MNYNCDRRGGYGDSAEEAANIFSTAPTSRNIPWQVGPVQNSVAAAHHAGNVNCHAAAGMVEAAAAGTGQGAIIFQGFLGGRGYGGMQPTSTAAVQARWDLNPGQILGENNIIQTSGNQMRDTAADPEQAAKWNINNNMTPSCMRLRGQLEDDELLGFSVDQRSGQPNQANQKIASPGNVVVVYKECQKNQALDSATHCVDGCGEFMRRGREGPEALQCMACGCHRSYHKSVRVGDCNGFKSSELGPDCSGDDLHISLSRIESVALNLMEATGRALPLLAAGGRRDGPDLAPQELDTVMKISIENLDHISKVTLSTVECIGILQAAGNTTQQSANNNTINIHNNNNINNNNAGLNAAAADQVRNHLDSACAVPDHGRLSSEVSPVSTTERRNSKLSPSPGSQFQAAQQQQAAAQGNRASLPFHSKVANAGNHVDTTTGVNAKPKRKRTQFTDEQRGKLKAYAEHAGWTIVGQRKDNIVAACQDIGVTPKTLKYWIHNAKQKLKRSHGPTA